jgi:hypothetical protein
MRFGATSRAIRGLLDKGPQLDEQSHADRCHHHLSQQRGRSLLAQRHDRRASRRMRNGKLLVLPAYRGARWQLTTRDPAEMTHDRGSRADVAVTAQAAVTRTNRDSRRRA